MMILPHVRRCILCAVLVTALDFAVLEARPPLLPQGPVAASMRADGGLQVQRGAGSAADTSWIDLLTAVELAQTLPMLSELRKIYDRTEMGFKLEQSRHITLFMPNNQALKASRLDLLKMPYADSIRVLSLHIIPELVKASELGAGRYEYETMAGVNVTLTVTEAELRPSRRPGGRAGLTGATTAQSTPLGGAANTYYQVTVKPIDGSVEATVLDPYGVDTANGVSYITDTLLVPADIAERYAGAVGGEEQGVFEVPDYIETTNQFHWQYGRVGGIPDAEIIAPPVEVERDGGNDALRGSRAESVVESDGQEEAVVGVLGTSGNHNRGVPSLRVRSSSPARDVRFEEEATGNNVPGSVESERSVRRAQRRRPRNDGPAER